MKKPLTPRRSLKTCLGALFVAVALFALPACAGPDAPGAQAQATQAKTVTVTGLDAQKKPVDVEVPYDPARVAVLDMAALDILDSLGLGDRVVGSADVSIDYLEQYKPGAGNDVANLGTIKNADLVEVASCAPDVIFIGGRLASVYDDLSRIAPVVYLSTDAEKGVVASTRDNARAVASIFGRESLVDERLGAISERIEALGSSHGGATALVGLFSGSSLSLLGDDARCSLLGRELGFDNLSTAAGEVTGTHGNEASWETLASIDPEYLFVLDRNVAIGSTGSNPAAKDAIENELVRETSAYKNGRIVYLASPDVWYTAEGGLTALDAMVADVEQALAA